MEGGDHSPQIPKSRGNETSQGSGAQDGHSCRQNRLGTAILFDITGMVCRESFNLSSLVPSSLFGFPLARGKKKRALVHIDCACAGFTSVS